MRQDIALDWADRLESGKYPQGRFALQRNGMFCCFGVLAEMAVEAGAIEKTPKAHWAGEEYAYDGDACGVTANVQKWSGMVGTEGKLDEETNLMDMNDTGFSFVEIAKI